MKEFTQKIKIWIFKSLKQDGVYKLKKEEFEDLEGNILLEIFERKLIENKKEINKVIWKHTKRFARNSKKGNINKLNTKYQQMVDNDWKVI